MAISVNAQTTEGRDFWFGFMENLITPDSLLIVITSDVATTGVVEMPLAGFTQNFSVTPGNSTRVLMPATAETLADDAIVNNAIHIQSVECVSVFTLNTGAYSSDAAVIFPTEALGTDYYLTTYVEFKTNIFGNPTQNFQSEFLIAATEDNTIVEITLSVNQNGHTIGVPYQITLNAGQVYQIGALHLDMTGTKVVGVNNKPFALFGGADCSNIGNCVACDHLFEQMFPISSWGREFVVIPLKTRQQDFMKIIASTNNTQLTINGAAPITINAGQTHNYYSGIPSYINSTEPISVAQFSLSKQCDNVDADPFYIMLSPIEQSLSKITFNAFTSAKINDYYLNITTPTSSISSVKLDGIQVPAASFTTVPSNPALSFAQLDITQGDHTIFSYEGVLATIYGYGSYESYGYSAGSNFFIPFELVDSVVCPGIPTTFNPIGDTTGVISYQWDFADGTPIDNSPTPTHTFQNYGYYEVVLLSLKLNACRPDTTKFYVNARGAGVVINGPSEICVSQSVTLNAVSLSATSYLWNTGETTNTITVTPSVTTDYIVNITSPTCNGADTFTVFVVNDEADFIATSICVGDTTFFTNLTNIDTPIVSTWNWDFGDNSSSQLANPNHIYNSEGTFQVTLSLTTQIGCQDDITKTITVNPEPVAQFGMGNICIYSLTDFQNLTTINSGSVDYTWLFGDNSVSSNLEHPTHQYNSADTFDVTLIAVSDFGCTDTLIQTIITSDGATVDFEADEICLGNLTSFTNLTDLSGPAVLNYDWDFADGNSSQLSDPTNNYTNSGNFDVILTVAFDDGCTISETVTVSVNPLPEVDNIINNITCYGLADGTINLTPTIGTPPFDYVWSPTLANSPSISNLDLDNYDLTLTDDNGCVNTFSYSITEPDSLYYSNLLTDVSCYGFEDGIAQILPFGGTLPYTYLWSNGESSPSNGGLIAGSYSFTFSDANGCTQQYTVDINQPDAIYVNIAGPDSVKFGREIVLKANETVNGVNPQFEWSYPYIDCIDCKETTSLPLGPFTYEITVTDDDGCTAVDEHYVFVDIDKTVYVPNVFTPNGDGLNDLFEIYTYGAREIDFRIFDRWGEMIYKTTDIGQPWDGTFKGKRVPHGVYVFTLQVIYLDADLRKMKGSVTIVR